MVSFTSKPIIATIALSYLSLFVAAQGTQFITGPCQSDADCAAGCCGFNTGRCAGPAVAQERDGGCGFGSGTPNRNALDALQGVNGGNGGVAASVNDNNNEQPAASQNNDAADAADAPAAAGTQFITGECESDADCASGCCGFESGLCAGPAVAQERDGGCGFGDAQPNSNALDNLQARTLFGRKFI